ncbi:MAG: hypothetical protein WBK76_00665, partial [Candidatus Saccharimonadales bacterium]
MPLADPDVNLPPRPPKSTPYAPGAAAPPKVQPTPITRPVTLQDGQRNSSDYGGPRAGVVPPKTKPATAPLKNQPYASNAVAPPKATTVTPIRNSHPVVDNPSKPTRPYFGGYAPGAADSNGNVVPQAGYTHKGGKKVNRDGSPIKSVSEQTPEGPIGSSGAGSTGTGNEAVLVIPHDGNRAEPNRPTKSGVAFVGSSQEGQRGYGSGVALSGSGAGLTDAEKVRKFSMQVDKAENWLGQLNEREDRLKSQMAGSTNPDEQREIAERLSIVQMKQDKTRQR